MKVYLKNIAAVTFLAVFLPCTVTLLLNGKQGIHQEERLPRLEYQVLYELLSQDFSWMDEGTLALMAVLYRTEAVRSGKGFVVEKLSREPYGESYERLYRAVEGTRGQVVQIAGEYRELPYHAVSAGCTRDGKLLGEAYSYILPVECMQDIQSENYLQVCHLTREELKEALGREIVPEKLSVERDRADYATDVFYEEERWSGENFRALLHLQSSCFWLEPSGNGVRITARGSGHGFGISLYTADRMAREGADYVEIIQKFYRDAECISIT